MPTSPRRLQNCLITEIDGMRFGMWKPFFVDQMLCRAFLLPHECAASKNVQRKIRKERENQHSVGHVDHNAEKLARPGVNHCDDRDTGLDAGHQTGEAERHVAVGAEE